VKRWQRIQAVCCEASKARQDKDETRLLDQIAAHLSMDHFPLKHLSDNICLTINHDKILIELKEILTIVLLLIMMAPILGQFQSNE
jgi:hypothetical protein